MNTVAVGPTVPELVEAAAERYGDRPFLRVGRTARTYAETREAAAGMAGALAAQGCRPGDRVAALLGNRVELVDLFLGCAWLGAVAVPLNTALRGRSLEHALREARPRFLYAEPEPAGRAVEAGYPGTVWMAGETAPRHPGEAIGLPPHPGGAAGPPPHPGGATPLPPSPVRPQDTAAVLFTSGTTGPARGVRCPQAQFVWWGRTVSDALRLTSDDVLFTCLPLFHTNALNTLAQAMTVGACVVIGERFSASRFWRQAADAGATTVHLLGAMVPMLLAGPPGPDDRAHRVWRGLSPATPGPLWEPFRERFGVTLVDGFGSTETNLVIGSTPEHHRPGYMGTVRPGFDARVVDGDLGPVPDGTPGELLVRSHHPYAFATGYLGDPEPAPDSWRRTGDRVVREPDGWFRFVDRIKDVIRRRGENISSYEVEAAVRSHPAVVTAAAFPVASELAEDEVMVAVVLRPGCVPDPADLARHCARELPAFAVPRYIEAVAELPLTETGKVRKAVLRERGVTPGTWDRDRASGFSAAGSTGRESWRAAGP
ncbi:AMP-binding protein [Streptomyces sp. GbtcB6]|uniref:AMP-binding protein n=1 Tax=Streptomyces sp. GbtcB6 TaxID=2824751 RepID=UPI001C2FB21C|nr:AMP-binding protein [Streptomyces sp. GbtcB6]